LALTSRSGVSSDASGNSASISAFGFFPLNPNLGRWMSGMLMSNPPDGFSMSTLKDGPSALISTSGAFTFASGNSASISPLGPLPLKPNFGRLMSGMLMSNPPDGFSMSTSSDGPLALTSRSGVFSFASGSSASMSALGPLPLNPNLGREMFGICRSNFPEGFSTSKSTPGRFASTSTLGASILPSGKSTSISAFGFLPFIPNLGILNFGICKSRSADGFSTSMSNEGPLIFASTSGPSIFAEGKSTSRSALGLLPFRSNLGRLILGRLKSMPPDGFSTLMSRAGPFAFISASGPSISTFGRLASISALGDFPLKPNLGRLISGMLISNFPEGFSMSMSKEGASAFTSKSGVFSSASRDGALIFASSDGGFTSASGSLALSSAFGFFPFFPNFGIFIPNFGNLNFPEGFSRSISRFGASALMSTLGPSIFAAGNDASTSTSGFFPFNPNLGKDISGI